MSQYLYQTRISDHLAVSPEGYLIATACVLCRSGEQQYRMSELDESSNSNQLVNVNRPVSEVTDPKFLASLPGKAFVVRHPSAGLITADTHSWSSRGVVLRAYVSDQPDENGNVLVLGDLCIHDPTAIQRVLDGERQLSVGYKYQLEQGADGGLEMRNLIANHVALVEAGRAGNAAIMDAAIGDDELAHKIDQLTKGTADDEIPESEDEDMIKKTATDQDELCGRVDKLCALLERLLSRKAADETLVPVATLPKSERGENPVVDDLRRLRPAIQASGDRKAIDAFNQAMTAAKRGVVAPATRLLAAYDGPSSGALSFEEMVRLRGQELMDGKMPSEPTDYKAAAAAERQALDQRAEPLSYEEQIRRAGEKMRANKFQRG
jgi:uncharacterized protein DUF2213